MIVLEVLINYIFTHLLEACCRLLS